MSGPDAPTEDASNRDGVLSYSSEWHAFVIGLYHGLRRAPLPGKNPDVTKESHYAKGAYVLGRLVQIAVVLLVGGKTLGVL